MKSQPAWLPDYQLGVAATLSHAEELIGQLADLLFDYQTTQPGGIFELEERPGFPNTQSVVTRVAPLPRRAPLLAADALVALRSALEHALFAEVEARDGPLTEKAARLVEIPAAKTHQTFEEWLRKRARNGPRSLCAGSDVVQRIEALQPFNRKDAENHPLARLVLHTNHSKHRTPAVTAVRLAAMYREDQWRSARDLPPRPEEPLRVGDIVAETPFGTKVPVVIVPTIGINRPGTDRWPVLITELDELSRWVRTQAVPRLIAGTDPPEPSLPATYEISAGHEDERSAIAAGSEMTAAERHQRRLGAASVRIDLVAIIDQMDGSPRADQISAWLKHLSDEEVLERMSRLRATRSNDPSIVLRNFEVLEGLCDEAVAFGEMASG